ncbi:uncharacterized protein K441DRAFT_202397 [Cenococcum geophilum 1.58]|uniref:Uncharacterized protein n=1 Tax=Cenococcum geophilum 1.58 TaxID=794803 RepID=A0ACC8EK67_9PEZI|nr:hypothetical protein K441DRAFT_35278 [Cenococcum geophilum 1.58]OCK91507.1 hypothetical protein K441DRAFT_202397 [Cenococcum geophilum 1.58]
MLETEIRIRSRRLGLTADGGEAVRKPRFPRNVKPRTSVMQCSLSRHYPTPRMSSYYTLVTHHPSPSRL